MNKKSTAIAVLFYSLPKYINLYALTEDPY